MKPSRPCARGIGPPKRRGKAKAAAAGASATLACLLALGCGHIYAPPANYGPEGQALWVKRVPRDFYVDTMKRFDRVAYAPGSTFVAEGLSPEQREVYEARGHPEYVRKPFQSDRGEKVTEWLYLRQNYLVQWVEGRKVFEGQATDTERTLAERGYPAYAWRDVDEQGLNRQTWVYHDEIKPEREVLSFSNGKLVYRKTSN